ncbi:MAG TPA: MMPL family transporter [Candidatus Saccharimonadales bacterium]|nr:MMPL family transporter [Candidatus Saccharimonadales bacterium]
MNRIFVLIGHASVRLRFLIVAAWIVLTVLAVQILPSLGSVAKDTTSGFLPPDVPSMQAAALAAPFQDSSLAAATLIAAREGGLTTADNNAIDAILNRIRSVEHVKVVADLGISQDGAARQVLVEANVPQFSAGGGSPADVVVAAIRSVATAGAPAGLQVHLTGEMATQVDNAQASGSSQDRTTNLSLLFIIVLLVLAFRAFLAPVVTLIPAVFVLVLSGPVIAQASKYGVQVSGITEFMLIVLILGAGTDYGVFLVFRVREELRRGLSGPDAVVRAVTRVGESITFSAFTVIAALVSLALAEFGLYQSLGPSLAIGIALMLLAGLTLLPALLAILGRAVFWPSNIKAQAVEHVGLWDRIGVIVTRRPGTTLGLGLALFGALALTLLTTGTAGFGDVTSSASGTDSAAGTALIAQHFPESTTSRTAILLRFDGSIWDNSAALGTAQRGLAALPEFRHLVGPLNPNGIPLTVDQLMQLHATLGPARALPPVPATNAVSVQLYNAYRATGQLISPDGRTIQFSAETNGGDTSSPAALGSVPGMRADVGAVARSAGAASSGLLGVLEFSYDVSHISNTDLERIIPLVALLIAVLLAAVMRSLVAPLYLVASVVLSYLAALGLTGLIFVHLGGQPGLNFVLPFLMFVFLMALGSDYNILVMSRIREEAHRMPLRDAVARAVGKTGSTVTTAGVILGGSFAVLAIAAGGTAGGDQIQQIGYGVAAGVLMDTFLVRSLLVPSVVVLLGRWNWWPSDLGRADAAEPGRVDVPGGDPAVS